MLVDSYRMEQTMTAIPFNGARLLALVANGLTEAKFCPSQQERITRLSYYVILMGSRNSGDAAIIDEVRSDQTFL